MNYELKMPVSGEQLYKLRAGDLIKLSGIIYTARDAAHERIKNSINKNEVLPIDLNSAAIYYCGPTPTLSGQAIGSCGPTTSGRMDDYTPLLMENGLRITIGKGDRSKEVVDAIYRHKGVYLVAVGGAAALMKSCVKSCECIAYQDLGCEAIHRLEVEDMPLIVWIDSCGTVLKS